MQRASSPSFSQASSACRKVRSAFEPISADLHQEAQLLLRLLQLALHDLALDQPRQGSDVALVQLPEDTRTPETDPPIASAGSLKRRGRGNREEQSSDEHE